LKFQHVKKLEAKLQEQRSLDAMEKHKREALLLSRSRSRAISLGDFAPQESVWREALERFKAARPDLQEEASPPLAVEVAELEGKSFKVVQEARLPGGTKQRALIPLTWGHSASEFVYPGPNQGFAQVALAHSAKLAGKKATLFLASRSHRNTQRAEGLGARVKEVEHGTIQNLTQRATQYCADTGAELLELGMHSGGFVWLMHQQLSERIREVFGEPPQRVWVAAGSGTLLTALRHLWPQTEFMVVQVGRTVAEEQLSGLNGRLFVAPEKFQEEAKDPPPYPSNPNYDAKVWQFVRLHGKEGDVIWNVA
jgi:hypothetical protein